jgi:hypothetical protein
MLKTLEFCLSTGSTIVPDGPDWLPSMTATGCGWSALATALRLIDQDLRRHAAGWRIEGELEIKVISPTPPKD